jgi:type 1 fimbriae regulatory protein FimB/type 1 fimbriae regulatory protein FimE
MSKKPAKKSKSQPPRKPANKSVRTREYLTTAEVIGLRDAAQQLGRNGFRDWLIIVLMYRHALRAGELTYLQWDQLDLNVGKFHVNRLKNGDAAVHPLDGDTIRALRKLQRERPPSPFVFASERGGPLTSRSVHHIVARAGVAAGIKFPVHPHQLRHAKGYQLAAKGEDTRAIQGYLGHKNIQHTVIYTKLDARRFKGFGSDR